ncbi:hypothetical protein C8Q80DRAFT_1206047 [Daedaleopsis nitida]|nr:hypothetical protein C8Q80DRAFT_1206047 [Daedaleopsis nitida]
MAPPKPDTVATLVDSLKLDTMEEVKFSDRLKTLFPWGPMPADLHFVVTASHYATEDEDTLEPLPYHEQRRRYFKATPTAAPSSEGSPQNFRDVHSRQDRKIYCGRPDKLSTPPSLLDETLCQLRSDLKSIKPSPNDIRCYNALRQVACVIYNNEGERRKAFTDTLREYGILPKPFSSGNIYPSYTTDGDLRSTCQGEEVISFLQEIKNEVSAGGKAEPSFEALLYWVATVRRILDAKTTKGEDWEQVNFPAILVMHFGPYLAIAAATYVTRPNVGHMCCIPLHVHSTNVAELEAGERAIAALRVAVHSLLKWYPTLHTRAHRGDFPFRDFYTDGSAPNIKHYFEYLEAIDKKRIFRVKRKSDGKLLCVKFSTRYSADAHRKAHELGLAPALHAVNYVGEWIMVVMDDMSKKYANTMYALRAEQPIPRNNPALSLAAARELVEKKLPALHAAGFVHGDVRTVNVLVRNEDAAPEPAGADVLLVDFDWAGPVGETVYPRRMNPAVERPEGAQSGEVITTEHDILMAQRLY